MFAPSGAGLSWREQIFIGLAWSPKATVQAALGGVPLTMIHETYNCNCAVKVDGMCCAGDSEALRWEQWGLDTVGIHPWPFQRSET